MRGRIHHVGITVGDIDRSLAFYTRLLGGDPQGPWDRSGPGVDRVTGYPGVVVRQAFVTTGEGGPDATVVELLQYLGGSETVLDPDNGHVGAAHVALTVADLDATLVRLRSEGVVVVGEPIVCSAPLAGYRAVYVLDPDRVRVELMEPPWQATPAAASQSEE